jgi:hypothetical protein
VLALPAPVKDLRLVRNVAETDAGRDASVVGGLDPLRDLFRQVLDVVRIRLALKDTGDRWRAVRVRCRDEHVIRGDAGELARLCLGILHQLTRKHATVDDDDGKLRFAVVEHEAAGVKRIVRPLRLHVGHVAVDGNREPGRRDVHGKCAGPEAVRVDSSAEAKDGNERCESRHGHFPGKGPYDTAPRASFAAEVAMLPRHF